MANLVASVRATCAELSHSELDMAVMGQLMATSPTVSVVARHKEDEHDKVYTALSHQGKPVYLRMFQFLHGIGKKRLRNLMTNLKENRLTPRVHGNAKRRPKHALSLPSTEFVVRFCSLTQNNMRYFSPVEFQDTAAPTFNFFHQV